MTKVVSYSDDNFDYPDGPFVVCELGNGCRVEVELEGHETSILVDASIHTHLSMLFADYTVGWHKLADACRYADALNREVKLKNVICVGGMWVRNKQKGLT